MAKHVIITIGRQFGSGGHEVGIKLARKLDLPLYDRNLVKMAAEKLQISEDAAKEMDEKALKGFLNSYGINPQDYAIFYKTGQEHVQPVSDKMYETQSRILKNLAEIGSCVIVGRCADFVLADEPGLINVFISAGREARIRRIAEKYNLSQKKAADKIKAVDRERSYYYESHTGRDWGKPESHEYMLNTELLGIDKAVDALALLYEAKRKELKIK